MKFIFNKSYLIKLVLLVILPISTSFGQDTYADNFNGGANYANSSGNQLWTTSWVEFDNNSAFNGRIRVNSNQLRFRNMDNANISRAIDLSTYSTVVLTLDYNRTFGNETISVQLWNGTGWNTVATTGAGTGSITYSLDPSEISGASSIRFITGSGTWNNTNETVFIDNVQFETGVLNITDGITTTTCNTIFRDTGGDLNQYQNNENLTHTICPDVPGSMLIADFTAFDVEVPSFGFIWDFLQIYDGSDTSGTLIGTFYNTNPPGTITATNPSGCLTFVFSSDNSFTEDGWEATISCSATTPQLAISDITVNENAGTADLTVSHSGGNAAGAFTVAYSTANNSANTPADYTTTSSTIAFSGTSPENQTLTVPIPIVDDNFAEATESFFVNLGTIVGDPSITISDGQGEITINDDDNASIAINDVTVNEGDGTATFTITLSGANVAGGFSVPYTLVNGSATNPADYTSVGATPSPINFAGNINETQQITIPIVDDTDIEGNHNFFVNLGTVSNPLVTTSDNQGEGTIEDNDAAISIDNISVNENAGTATFTVTHVGPDTTGPFAVSFTTANNTATAGSDYTTNTGTLNFSGTSGDTESITVTILDDISVEGNETYFINFTSVSNPLVDITDQGIGTIVDVEIENPRPYEERITINVRGNFDMIGNTNLICTANCPGTPTSNNPSVVMGYASIDGTTINSSSANLTLPSGATVAWAGLYWGGSYNSTFGGITNPDPSLSLQQVQFREPGAGTYSAVNANLTNIETGSFAGWNTFMSFADVTSIVQTSGSGSYTVADIPLITGSAFTGPFGGWTMVIIYEDPSDITRSVSIWDGFDFFGFGANDSFTVTGLLTPSTGAFDTDAGYFGMDGDSGGFTGDFVAINGNTLSNALNPANNTLNSTISKFGVDVGGRNPNQSFNWGIDADIFDATGFVPNNATTLNVDLGSASEGIWGGVFAVSTEVAFPAVASKNFSPATIGYGEESTVTITLENPATGVDLTNLSLTDNLPSGMTISTSPDGTSSCGGTITAVSGSDNFSISGVNLPAGNTCTFTFDVIGTLAGSLSNTVSSGDITNDQNIPLAGTTTGILNVVIRSVITNRRITYRVNRGSTTTSSVPTGTLTTDLSINNFDDGQNSAFSPYQLQVQNTTATPFNYEIYIQNVPYASIPGLNLGNHTLITTDNGDGTFNYLFTSTMALGAFQNTIISGSGAAPSPQGTGPACGCVSFYKL
ncbi:beta strand repeat-containing protein [Aquimarina algiphila]|uniref:beta strand repeat-containing protein n=1 Tax=Aquimarina algiphila TaxID=2047982 RepID=UPI002492487A|nr:Calx-beta domain-containing protein [Aquimarina algiphila]